MLRRLNEHEKRFRLGIFLAASLPASILLYQFKNEGLGVNPFETLIEDSGFWAILFLLITLGITPMRRWCCWLAKAFKTRYGKRLSDWNFVIKSRRQLGLWSFFYASVHFFVYLHFELGWWFEDFWLDIRERKFISLGVLAWVPLVLMAVTSPDRIRKKMGKRWRQLHRLMYPVSILAVLHLILEAKPNENAHLWYACVAVILLGHRIVVNRLKRFKRKDDTGMPSYR